MSQKTKSDSEDKRKDPSKDSSAGNVSDGKGSSKSRKRTSTDIEASESQVSIESPNSRPKLGGVNSYNQSSRDQNNGLSGTNQTTSSSSLPPPSNNGSVQIPNPANHPRIPRSHRQTANELYVSFATDFMYPPAPIVSDESDSNSKRQSLHLQMERPNALGYLLNPLRQRTVMEKWSPYEITVFEACIALYGKNFRTIHKAIRTKTPEEVIEFYYDWKKTSHYKEWKKSYSPDERDFISPE